MCDRICKTCGGDDVIASIAEKMGFRPDVAFMRIRKLERFIREGIKKGYITLPNDDPVAMDLVNGIMKEE